MPRAKRVAENDKSGKQQSKEKKKARQLPLETWFESDLRLRVDPARIIFIDSETYRAWFGHFHGRAHAGLPVPRVRFDRSA